MNAESESLGSAPNAFGAGDSESFRESRTSLSDPAQGIKESSSPRDVCATKSQRTPNWFQYPDSPFWRTVRAVGMLALFFTLWGLAVRISHSDLFPTPGNVVRGIIELFQKGLLLKYIVASLFRVSWGFALAVLIGVPLGLILGWYTRLFQAFNPIIQILRPISPIAWIPVAILWFGVSDAAPIFLIFLASVFPITVSAIAAVQNMQPVYLRAAQNFGLSRGELFRRVIFRASLPQIITGIRIALGVAWLVVVAAEMIAVNSGLGYLIIDARNAGKRYDLVVAGMVMIGFIGLGLDLLVRQLEKFDEVSWGYAKR
jgi:NitT/TauT family transport system permease protein